MILMAPPRPIRNPRTTIFAQRLSAARKFRRLSQEELAQKTQLKQSAISQFETGRRSPSFENLRRVADALEISADYLLGRSSFVEIPAISKQQQD